jgi:L-amino acid N-acyltransferase
VAEPQIVSVRDATADDLEAITGLYNALIPTTTTAWTERLQTIDERAAWFDRQEADGFPVLVADDDGSVVGFGAYGHFRGAGKWQGYRYTAEHTIHVAESHWGTGVGAALLSALIDRARADGIHVLVAAIDADNHASIAFHRRLGFSEVGRLPQVGHKFGQWLDLVLMQQVLDDRTTP